MAQSNVATGVLARRSAAPASTEARPVTNPLTAVLQISCPIRYSRRTLPPKAAAASVSGQLPTQHGNL